VCSRLYCIEGVVLSSVGRVEGDHCTRVCLILVGGGGITLHFYIRRGLEEEVSGSISGRYHGVEAKEKQATKKHRFGKSPLN
jgi:hypothetical protein